MVGERSLPLMLPSFFSSVLSDEPPVTFFFLSRQWRSLFPYAAPRLRGAPSSSLLSLSQIVHPPPPRYRFLRTFPGRFQSPGRGAPSLESDLFPPHHRNGIPKSSLVSRLPSFVARLKSCSTSTASGAFLLFSLLLCCLDLSLRRSGVERPLSFVRPIPLAGASFFSPHQVEVPSFPALTSPSS